MIHCDKKGNHREQQYAGILGSCRRQRPLSPTGAQGNKAISLLRSKQKLLVQTSGDVEDAKSKKASRSTLVQVNYPFQKTYDMYLTCKGKMFPFDFFGMKRFKFPPWKKLSAQPSYDVQKETVCLNCTDHFCALCWSGAFEDSRYERTWSHCYAPAVHLFKKLSFFPPSKARQCFYFYNINLCIEGQG